MQKFTRALTREIEVGGERLAVTLSEQGLSVRPVGARRQPHTLSWPACLCACVGHPLTGEEPTPDQLAEVVKKLKAGGKKSAADEAPEPSAGADHQPDKESGHETAPPQPAHTEAPRAGAGDALPELLARLDRWLAEHRKRFHAGLMPGATGPELDALQIALGLPLPDELRTWLTWHNGQSPDVVGTFESSWNLMSTQEIADDRKALDADASAKWDAGWVPLLNDGGDNYVFLDVRQPGLPLRDYWRGKSEHDAVAPSLTAWVKDFVTALEAGQYAEDPERGTFHRKQG